MPDPGHMVELFTTSNIVAGFFSFLLISWVVALFSGPQYPRSIPWVGYGTGWLATLKNTFASLTKTKQWLDEGYQTYNKKGKSYVLPASFGYPAEIIVPQSQIPWMLDQPDHVLSGSEAHFDVLHGDYSFLDPVLLRVLYHEHILYKNLTRNLNAIIPELSDEVVFVTDEAFGMDTQQWRTINLMETLLQVVPRLTNRMLAGKVLCRNKAYLDYCLAFTMDIVRNMIIFPLTPNLLRRFIGPILSLPGKWHFHKAKEFMYPVIHERRDLLKRIDSGHDKTLQEPNDFLNWVLRTGQLEGKSELISDKKTSQYLFLLNFASIHTTSLTAQNVLLDILSSDPADGVIDALREEAEGIFREDGYEWTKAGLARMYKIDSAIRESMRVNPLAATLSLRKVVAHEGITNPTEGWHAPYGAYISCPVSTIHADSEIHLNANKYDAFRYSREREAYEAKPAEEKNSMEGLKIRATGLVTTSEVHMPFGHGRHTCPGRFFVAHELKMVVAYLLMNYDLKHLEERPKSKWVGRGIVPPSNVRIEVRRRK